jgi:hypothetical protein
MAANTLSRYTAGYCSGLLNIGEVLTGIVSIIG